MFHTATIIVDFTISVFFFFIAQYAIITHIAKLRVKNICPAAAVHVDNSNSLEVSINQLIVSKVS